MGGHDASGEKWASLADDLRRYCVQEYGSGALLAVTLHLKILGEVRLPVPLEPWHTQDFQTVCWQGIRYEFSPKQRVIIQALWNAYEAGRPIVDQDHLFRLAETSADHLSQLFRKHPAWNTLILSIGFSAYHLAFAWVPPLAECESDEPEISA